MKKHISFLLFVALLAGLELQAQTGNVLLPPVKPQMADNKSPVMEIVIDPKSFQELTPYKGMKFQIDVSKTPLNPRDSSEEWNNLELIRAGAKGNYMARFSNAKRTATYAVKPVFEGEDYNAALATFEKENAAYKQRVAERERMAKVNRAQYIKDSIQDQQTAIENEKKERLSKINIKRELEIANQKDLDRKRKDSIQSVYDTDLATRIFRIDSFGFLRSDMAKALNLHYIHATFKTEAGEPINSYLAVYIRGVKGCISTHEDHFSVKPGADNMILANYKGRIAYVSFEEFRKLNITTDTKAQTFIMKVVSEKDNNIEFIKRVAMQ